MRVLTVMHMEFTSISINTAHIFPVIQKIILTKCVEYPLHQDKGEKCQIVGRISLHPMIVFTIVEPLTV